MPANRKHLIHNPWIKTSKIIAAILGGMVTSIVFHLALAYCIGFDYVVPTSLFSVFLLWGFFIVMVYWIQKAWISWVIFFAITTISVVSIYSLKG